MKAFPIVLLICAGSVQAWAQGQISFGNRVRVAGIDAPVFDSDCATPLAGATFLAQVYAGRAPDSLSPVGWVMPFRTGEAAGYIYGVVITIPGTFQDDLVYTQLRAWEARAGASFEEAVASGGKYGMSNIVPMRTVMPPGAPNVPVGLQSFCLVPEPSSGTLLVLSGGLWLLAARRRGAQGLGRPGGVPILAANAGEIIPPQAWTLETTRSGPFRNTPILSLIILGALGSPKSKPARKPRCARRWRIYESVPDRVADLRRIGAGLGARSDQCRQSQSILGLLCPGV